MTASRRFGPKPLFFSAFNWASRSRAAVQGSSLPAWI